MLQRHEKESWGGGGGRRGGAAYKSAGFARDHQPVLCGRMVAQAVQVYLCVGGPWVRQWAGGRVQSSAGAAMSRGERTRSAVGRVARTMFY